jgi:hypothetical protein
VTILCSSYPSILLRLSIRLFIWMQVFQRMIRATIELHHYSVDMFLGLCVTLLVWHADILYCDLPCVPKPLYPHLKKLFFPYDYDGTIDGYIGQLILMYKRLKRQPLKTLVNLIKNHDILLPTKTVHMKQI